MTGTNIRVLVVDDFEPWHEFITKTLQDEPKLEVIAHAYDGAEGVHQAQELRPDLIVLDIGLPKLNGLEAARRIREVSPASKILFTSENRSPDILDEALRTGAGGYVVKSDGASELLPAIDAILRGKRFVSTCLMDHNSIDNADSDSYEKVVASSQRQSIDSHNLRFYTDDAAFVDGLCQSIETALENGHASVVLATESHRSDVLQTLRADGVNVDAAVESGLLTLLDVADSLSTVMASAATDENRSAQCTRLPEMILDALQTAKERHLHLAVG